MTLPAFRQRLTHDRPVMVASRRVLRRAGVTDTPLGIKNVHEVEAVATAGMIQFLRNLDRVTPAQRTAQPITVRQRFDTMADATDDAVRIHAPSPDRC